MSDYKCPKCNATSEGTNFNIVATATFEVSDMGTEDYGDVEWNDDSPMWCRACGHSGIVADFTNTEEEMAS